MTSYLESKIQTGKPSDLVGKQIPVINTRDHVLDIDVVPELDIFHFLQGQVFINSDTNLCFKIVGWVIEVAHRYSDGTPKQYAFAACKAFYSGHFFVMSKKELEAGGCHSATPQELRREWDANRENITHRYEYELKQFADRFEEFRFPKGERVKEESAKAAEKEGRTQTLLARFVTRDIGEPDSKDGLFVGTMTQEGLQQFKRGHVFEIVRWEKEPDIEETSVLWPMKGAKAEIHINVLGPSYIKPTMESGRTRVSWGETHAAINTVCWSTEIGDVLSFEGKHLFLTEAEYVSLCEGNHD
jgi:hypothetical protein